MIENSKDLMTVPSEFDTRKTMHVKGNCHDKAVMENFFGRLKTEMFYVEEDTFADYEDFKRRAEEYISRYNKSRIKDYQHWKSPNQVLSETQGL